MADAVQQAPAMTDEQHRIAFLCHNLLATLDAVVPNSTIHYAVEQARRAVKTLEAKAGTVTTAPPTEWTFMGHWRGSRIVVDYVVPGVVNDDRDDGEGIFPDGLWAGSGGGATVEEAEENAKAEYEAEYNDDEEEDEDRG